MARGVKMQGGLRYRESIAVQDGEYDELSKEQGMEGGKPDAKED